MFEMSWRLLALPDLSGDASRAGSSRSLTRVVMTQQPNIWRILKQLQICALSWKLLALLDLSRHPPWWREAGHSPEWSQLNNQQMLEL